MNQKLTIYQRLNRVLSGDSASQVKNYVIDRDVLKDLDPAAYQKEKLEAQQTLYLSNQWKRVDNELYQRAVFYEPTRIAAYFDYESMEFCLHGDTQIVTPSGSMSIKELSDLGRDHEFIVYAYDHNIKKVVPALARNAHHTRNEMTYKVTFDDGTFIIATYDHQFMKRDGSFERVRNLKPGDSMMPFYRKSFYNNENYNWVYTCNSNDGHNGWVAEHNLIAEWFYDKKLNENEVVHHKDFIGKNNSPENLVIMDKSEHQSYHCQLNNQKLWQDPHYCTKMCEVAKRLGKYSWNGKRSGKNNPTYFTIPFDNIIEIAKQIKTLKGTANALGISHTKLQREIMWAGYKDWHVFCEAYGIERSKYSTARVKNESYVLNHKIIRIEEYGVEPVYDLTVPGYKNFATDTIFSHNTPEISAALDIFMEEATTPDEKGNVLTIYSDDVRIKQELETLFYDVLDVNTNLAPWIRNTCKYGDNFIAHKIIPEKGIIGVTQLPNIEITRTESMYPKAVGLDMANSDKENIRFYWKNKDLEFNSFEVSHFRLLGDDRRLPYGTCLKGDTKINTENGVEEISKIQVGTNVWSFNPNTQKKELSPILDKVNSGTKEVFNISTQHNYVEASKEHRIMVVENNIFMYKNVIDLKIGDLLVINKNEHTSTDILIDKSKPKTNKNGWFNNINLIPDYITEEFAQLYGFLIGDGWIPTYNNQVCFALGTDDETNEYYINLLKKFSGKEVIKNDKQAVCNSKLLKTILKRLGFIGKSHEKRIPEWVYCMKGDYQKAFIAGLMDADGWASSDKWVISLHIELNNKPLIQDFKNLLQRVGYKSGTIRSRHRIAPIIEGRQTKKTRKSYMITFYDSYNSQIRKYDINNRLSDDFIIEPIKSIESIGNFETFDIYVENENHNFYANNIVVHNSILEKGRRIWKQLMLAEDAMLVYRITRAPERRVYKVFVGNMDDKDVDAYVDKIANTFKRSNVVNSENGTSDLRYNQLSVDQDFFVPIRDVGQTNPIETLPGAQNLSEIADIEYIQQKLFAALRIPKAFLGFSDPIGEGKNLAILDVRFARAVNRVQKAMIQELNKIAIIHLYSRGFVDDLNNFRLSMTSPSTQADILKLERWSQKITLYRDAVTDAGNGFGAMSMTLAKKTLLDMSDDEVKLDIQQQAVEKAAGEELKVLSEVIKQTGVFNDLYKIYNIDPNNLNIGPKGTGEGETDMPLGGGGGGGGGAVPFGVPFGAPEPEQGEESGFDTLQSGGIGGASNEEPPKEGGEEQKPDEEEEKDNLSENVRHLSPFQNRPRKTLAEINQERMSAKMRDIINQIEKLEKKK